MSASRFFSKSGMKASLWMSAIAGGLVAASTMFAAIPSRDLHGMQLDEFSGTASEVTEANPVTDSAATIVLALGGVAALGWGIHAARKHQRLPPATQSGTAKPSLGQLRTTSYLHQANRSLQRKLLLLLHEDQQAAERLIQQASFRSPGKSPDWYLEKVIYDLQRDRGRI